MKTIIQALSQKSMRLKLYSPEGMIWTLHSKHHSEKVASNTVKQMRNGEYKHVMWLTEKDEGKYTYSIYVVDACCENLNYIEWKTRKKNKKNSKGSSSV